MEDLFERSSDEYVPDDDMSSNVSSVNNQDEMDGLSENEIGATFEIPAEGNDNDIEEVSDPPVQLRQKRSTFPLN